MSRKSSLKAILIGFKKESEKANAMIKNIKECGDYTKEGQEKLIKDIKDSLKNKADRYRSQGLDIMNKSIDEYKQFNKDRTAQRLKDKDYQQSLANTLRILELGSGTMNVDGIQTLIDSYSSDSMAMSAFKGILSKNDRFNDLQYPVDTKEKNCNLQEQLKGNLNRYINNDEWDGLTGTGMAINSLMDTLDNMDDDLVFSMEGDQE